MLDEYTVLNIEIRALIDTPNTLIEIEIPRDGFEIISGSTQFNEDLSSGSTATYQLEVLPTAQGQYTIAASAKSEETDYIFDLPDATLQHLIVIAKKLGLAIDRSVACERVGLIVAGLEVPHAHIHLVPIQDVGDINFAKAKPAEEADLASLADRIRSQLA